MYLINHWIPAFACLQQAGRRIQDILSINDDRGGMKYSLPFQSARNRQADRTEFHFTPAPAARHFERPWNKPVISCAKLC